MRNMTSDRSIDQKLDIVEKHTSGGDITILFVTLLKLKIKPCAFSDTRNAAFTFFQLCSACRQLKENHSSLVLEMQTSSILPAKPL